MDRRPFVPTGPLSKRLGPSGAPILSAALLLLLPLQGPAPDGLDARTEAPLPAAPNLLLITLDTTRADRLGCYGYAKAQTPNLDALAREGATADQAIAVAPLTLPSHASILTSLYPPRHGVRDNADFRLSASELTLAEHLEREGYRTAAVVASIVLDGRLGLSQGFGTYDEPRRPPAARPGPGEGVHYESLLERPAAKVTDAALAALNRLGSRPFFLWVHYYDPHAEYAPPAPYSRRFADRPYDGEIAYMDAEIGRLLNGFRRRRLLDRTLVVVVADHGESLGEHGEASHGLLPYEATLRVPLIVRLPGVVPAGARILRPVSGVDIAPTALEIMSRRALPGAQGTSFARELGWRSLAGPRAPGEGPPSGDGPSPGDKPPAGGRPPSGDGPSPGDRPPPGEGLPPGGLPAMAPGAPGGEGLAHTLYAEALLPERAYGWSPLFALRRGPLKFIAAPQPELYDLVEDPGELHNLAPGRPDQVEAWKARLLSLMAGFGSPDASSIRPMDPEERERLASLGYISPAPAPVPGPTRAEASQGAPPPDSKGRVAAEPSPGAAAPRPDPKALVAVHNAIVDAKRLVAARRIEEARARLASVLVRDPANPAALSLAGTLEFSMGARAGGLDRLHAAALAAPGVYENQRNLANALHVAGRLSEASRAYRSALAIRPASGDDHYALGNVLFALRDTALAIAEYKEAIRLGAATAGVHAALGVALASRGDTGAAEAELRKAVEIDPSLSGAWSALGSISEKKGRWDAACRSFGRAVAGEGATADARLHRAFSCRQSGTGAEADRAARDFLGKHPAHPGALFVRATLSLDAGDTSAARRGFEAFLAQPKIDPMLEAAARKQLARLGP